MKHTEKLGLKKPEVNDYININDINDNMDILDEEISNLKEGTTIIEELQTEDKTLAGAINELKDEVNKKETPVGAQQKADAAEINAKNFTTQEMQKHVNKVATQNEFGHVKQGEGIVIKNGIVNNKRLGLEKISEITLNTETSTVIIDTPLNFDNFIVYILNNANKYKYDSYISIKFDGDTNESNYWGLCVSSGNIYSVSRGSYGIEINSGTSSSTESGVLDYFKFNIARVGGEIGAAIEVPDLFVVKKDVHKMYGAYFGSRNFSSIEIYTNVKFSAGTKFELWGIERGV